MQAVIRVLGTAMQVVADPVLRQCLVERFDFGDGPRAVFFDEQMVGATQESKPPALAPVGTP
eukprot:scaffold180581_cov25-Tisochrysis_lutea.AAC.2